MDRTNLLSRESNFELLRIVAMLLVLIVHANLFTLGVPTVLELQAAPLPSFTRLFIGSLSIVCVNVFILISGWFEIKPSVKSISKFVFLCLFYSMSLYVIFIITGISQFHWKDMAGCLFLLKSNWFIKAYLGLYILTPVLNTFVKIANKSQIKLFLIVFFTYQTIYGWYGAVPFLAQGHSTLSFIGLYILGRYLNLHGALQNIGGG